MPNFAFRSAAKIVFGADIFLILASVLSATSYNYKVSESLPCLPGSCSGKVEVGGTITSNLLGNLGASNITSWNLSLGSGSSAPFALSPADSTFAVAGALQIVATTSTLEFTVSQSGDGFNFSDSKNGAGWLYGAFSSAAQFLSYPAENGKIETGYQLLSLPTTFTAESFGRVVPGPPSPAPEPKSLTSTLVAAVFLLFAAKRRKHKRVYEAIDSRS